MGDSGIISLESSKSLSSKLGIGEIRPGLPMLPMADRPSGFFRDFLKACFRKLGRV
jgi:hypothetical protein